VRYIQILNVFVNAGIVKLDHGKHKFPINTSFEQICQAHDM